MRDPHVFEHATRMILSFSERAKMPSTSASTGRPRGAYVYAHEIVFPFPGVAACDSPEPEADSNIIRSPSRFESLRHGDRRAQSTRRPVK